MGFRIEPVTIERQRRPRREDKPHLSFIGSLGCAVCGSMPVDAAHIRIGCRAIGKRETGVAEKSSDQWTIPLCRIHHEEQHHTGNELRFWSKHGIDDPFRLALALFSESGNWEICEGILAAHRRMG